MRVPFALNVKVTCNSRPSIVAPSACSRGSSRGSRGSATTSKRESKNICSASLWVTPCFWFFRALPSSHSKPTTRSKSITIVYYHNIRTDVESELGQANHSMAGHWARSASVNRSRLPPSFCFQQPILSLEEFDDDQLMPMNAARDQHEQKRQQRRHRTHGRESTAGHGRIFGHRWTPPVCQAVNR